MSRPAADELGGKNGQSTPGLYDQCVETWNSLSGLVHDSLPPFVAKTDGYERFVIRPEISDSGMMLRSRASQLLSRVDIASWIQQPGSGDDTGQHERMFLLGRTEEEAYSGGSVLHRTELIVGRYCVLQTDLLREEVRQNGKGMIRVEQYLEQPPEIDSQLVETLMAILRGAPESTWVTNFADEKKRNFDRLAGAIPPKQPKILSDAATRRLTRRISQRTLSDLYQQQELLRSLRTDIEGYYLRRAALSSGNPFRALQLVK